MPVSPNAMAAMNGGAEPQQPQGNGLQDLLTGWVRGSFGIAAMSPPDIRNQLKLAQDSFAGMIQGALAKKRGPALEARKTWETASMGALQANEERLAAYGAVWSDNDIQVEDKMMQIREIAARYNDDKVGGLTASPEHFSTFGKLLDMQMQQQKQAMQATTALDQQIKQIEAKLPPDPNAQQGGVPSIAPYFGKGTPGSTEGVEENAPFDPSGEPGKLQ